MHRPVWEEIHCALYVGARRQRFGEKQAQAFAEQQGVALTRIGSCAVGSGVRFTDRGVAVRVPAGYDHFAE